MAGIPHVKGTEQEITEQTPATHVIKPTKSKRDIHLEKARASRVIHKQKRDSDLKLIADIRESGIDIDSLLKQTRAPVKQEQESAYDSDSEEYTDWQSIRNRRRHRRF